MNRTLRNRVTCLACLLAATSLPAAEDLLVADFEQDNYGGWTATGEAFGSGPADGTLPGQMHVEGFQGKGLVNSFLNGDGTTGTLTSPGFKLERDYLSFLIGGGGHSGATCMNLLHNGAVVRTATGPNTQPGGSERLEPQAWNVAELRGQSVTLQIVDRATGGWGHINVDHIVQTDIKPQIPILGPQTAEFTVENEYLILPIRNGVQQTELVLEIDGRPVRRYSVELATRPDEVDWHAFFTLSTYKGKPARVTAARATAEGFGLVRQSDRIPGADSWYSESLRPQFHFSQAVGWNNDPNGMVYLDGEWHLFFQHNPVGWNWGNMTWGHAVSTDLVHWKELPAALFPKTMAVGDCFSGGATVDHRNTAGWKTGEQDVLVAFLTDTGTGEAVAYSNDRGRSFTWYQGNPVVKHRGRDPKVIWYAYDKNDNPLNGTARQLGGHWVMVVYDEQEKLGRNAAFYTSTNLKEWTAQSHLPGYFECTELFELPVTGASESRWVVFAADARYAIGQFDGRTFTPEHEGKHRVHWGDYYASQTFDNAPNGRRIQIGWVRIAMRGMPFNQTFSFPHELTLRPTADGVRMFATPIAEIEKLHKRTHRSPEQPLGPGSPVSLAVAGELFDVRATFELGTARQVGLDIGGNRIVYDVASAKLGEASLQPVEGRVSIQVLVDRPMLEICGNDGRVFVTTARRHTGEVQRIDAVATGGQAKLLRLEAHELNSIWH